MKFIQSVINKALELGAQKCGSVEVEHITFDPGLRKNCEMNYCGSYGKNYMCPPDAGEIHELIQQAKGYEHLILFQTISPLEDSFDIEGMQEAAERHANLVDKLSDYLVALPGTPRYLILGAGGCHLCQPCGKVTGDPCRHPDRLMPPWKPMGFLLQNWRSSAACSISMDKTLLHILGRYCFQNKKIGRAAS